MNACKELFTQEFKYTHRGGVSLVLSRWLTFRPLFYRRRRQLWTGHWRWGLRSCASFNAPPESSTPHITSPDSAPFSFVNPAHRIASVWCPDDGLPICSSTSSGHRSRTSSRSGPSATSSSPPAFGNAGSAHRHRSRCCLSPVSHPGCQPWPASQS